MSLFDLFRGFFGISRGQHRGQRDPFFDVMTRDEDDDDDDDEDGFYFEGQRGDQQDQQDPLDGNWRFGFSLGPDGMRIQEPPVFGHVLRQMEEIFSQLGHWDGQSESGPHGVPSIMPPPPPSQDRAESRDGASGGNPLRNFMLKSPDSHLREPEPGPSREPRIYGPPFSKFNDIWRQPAPEEEHKEDRDLDSAVSSGGLDQIFTPPAGQVPSQPRVRSFFQSVTVTKVVKPDGTVEERRTVRDGKGNEETTVTHSGGPGAGRGRTVKLTLLYQGTLSPVGGQHPFSDMRDDDSLFSRFFRGFR